MFFDIYRLNTKESDEKIILGVPNFGVLTKGVQVAMKMFCKMRHNRCLSRLSFFTLLLQLLHFSGINHGSHGPPCI